MRRTYFVSFLILLVLSVVGWAQSDRATITGTVIDETGASMPNVKITATEVEDGAQFASATSTAGVYAVSNLPVGRYSIKFEKQGFKAFERTNVTLSATQVVEVNAKLVVGATSEEMNITEELPLLQTETADVGTNMKGRVVNDLPLSIYGGGRFIENFAVAITPGYSPLSNPYEAVVNGSQWFTKDFTIDGTSGTANIQGDSMMAGPTMEAVDELQAQTSGLDAQRAITGGGVMSFTLKSGTNRFHGSGLLYGHNELLDANTWTNNSEGLPREKARAWDYGGSFGGPIIKNKTFFFGAIERYVQNDFRLGGFGSTVPTADFLNGNFSALLADPMCHTGAGQLAFGSNCGAGTTPVMVQDNSGATLQARVGMIFDPATGNQFTGNVIPNNRISSVSRKINSIYKQSYAPEGNTLSSNSRLLISNSPSQTPIQAVVKMDQNFSYKDHLSGSWVYNHRPRTLVDSGGIWSAGSTDGGPLAAARTDFYRSEEFRVSETHTFSPRVLNAFNLTYNWDKEANEPSYASNANEELGFGATGASNFPRISFGSDVNGRNVTSIGNSFQGDVAGATFVAADSVSWVRGKHTLNLGGEFRAHQVNSHSGQGALSFNFTNKTTGAASQDYANYVGFGFASYLLGDVNTANQTTPANLYGRRKSVSLFAQDSWKLRSNLTVNMGLRWDYNFRFHEKYGHWANFDPDQIDPTYDVPGRLVYASSGSDSFERHEYGKNFGPQIGLEYSPLRRLVVRGSLGMIYMPAPVAYFDGVPNGFAPGFQGTDSVGSPFNWDNGYPGVYQPGSKSTDPTSLFPVTSVDPNSLRVGYSVAFNAGVQYELTKSMRLDVSYVGNRGHRLSDTSLAWNEGPSTEFLRLTGQIPGMTGWSNYVCSASDAASYGISYPYSGFCGPLLAAIATYPQMAAAVANSWYYPNLLYVGLPKGQRYYDSMVVDVIKTTGHGLSMDVSYTLSRQESNTFTAQQEYNGYYTSVQDFSNMGVTAHALTGYDQTHVVKGYVSYDLPFGAGKRSANSQSGVVNEIVGNWTVAGTFVYYSGQPFMISANNPYWPQWGNLYPNIDLTGFSGPNDPSKYNPAADPANPPATNFYVPKTIATDPAPGRFGKNAGPVTDLRCPGAANENLSVMKVVPFGEGRYRLQFRVEFYNAFNRHYYQIQGCGGTRSTVGAANFGLINGVADNPRTGQFGLRFDF